MGEVAEMLLDGTLCGTCGCYMDGEADGYPRYCSDDCDPFHDEETAPAQQRPKKPSAKDRGGYKRWEEARQATVDVICSRIINEMGGKKMSKKTRKGITAEVKTMLVGLLNVDGLVVIKRFEEDQPSRESVGS